MRVERVGYVNWRLRILARRAPGRKVLRWLVSFGGWRRSAPVSTARLPVVRGMGTHAIPALEHFHEHHAGDEPAKVHPEGDAAGLLGEDAGDPTGKLKEGPVDQRDPRGQRATECIRKPIAPLAKMVRKSTARTYGAAR